MVRLKNIVIEKSTIQCELYPEDSVAPGHLLVNTDTGELLSFTLPEKYSWCRNHVNHAHKKLLALCEQGNIPKDTLTVMWY